jgi:hypothetical protein
VSFVVLGASSISLSSLCSRATSWAPALLSFLQTAGCFGGRAVPRSLLELVDFSLDSGGTAKVVPRPWFGLLFRDLAEVWVAERAWRDSNPRPTA